MILKYFKFCLVVLVCVITSACSGIPCGKNLDVSYVFLSEFDPWVGGIPTNVKISYISSDGVIQSSRERNDDRIMELKAKTIEEPFLFFESIKGLVLPSSQKEKLNWGSAIDGGPALTRVLVCDKNGWRSFWEGNADNAPKVIIKLISDIKSIIELSKPETKNQNQFLRMYPVGNTFLWKSKAGRSITIDPSMTISKAISYPYRLVPVSMSKNLNFLKNIRHDTPLSTEIKNTIYRIHLVLKDKQLGK